jgi:hypothetical protein
MELVRQSMLEGAPITFISVEEIEADPGSRAHWPNG